jgi:hypothetical protein|nr:unnamed protein product [uncultured bacterium]
MIKYFMISLIGIIVFMNGYCIKKGNIGLLHLHNRIMILNEDKDSYCRMIGRGLMIMGLGALISSLLSACLNNENYLFILLASSAIGVTMYYTKKDRYSDF